MTDRALQLAARRNALRAHCEVQRSHLFETAQDIQWRLANIDRAIDMVQHYAHRPLLVIGGLGLFAMLGPRRLLRWASRGAFLFTSGRRLLSLIRR
jgi:hypothetical protein